MRPNQAKFFTHVRVCIEASGKIQRLVYVYYRARRSSKTADLEDAECLVKLLCPGVNFTHQADHVHNPCSVFLFQLICVYWFQPLSDFLLLFKS